MVELKKSGRIQEAFRKNIKICGLLDMVGQWSPDEFHDWVWTDTFYFQYPEIMIEKKQKGVSLRKIK